MDTVSRTIAAQIARHANAITDERGEIQAANVLDADVQVKQLAAMCLQLAASVVVEYIRATPSRWDDWLIPMIQGTVEKAADWLLGVE